MAAPTLNLLMIDSYDPTTLVLVDVSIYPSTFTVTNPTIEVTPPGYSKVAISFNNGQANVLRAADLQITCDDSTCVPLPDGVYTFTYSVYPANLYSVTKNFLRVNQIVCKLQQLYLKVDMECRCPSEYRLKTKKTLSEIKLLIEGAIAAANNNDQVSSFQLYRKADDMLNNILRCSKNCGCK